MFTVILDEQDKFSKKLISNNYFRGRKMTDKTKIVLGTAAKLGVLVLAVIGGKTVYKQNNPFKKAGSRK